MGETVLRGRHGAHSLSGCRRQPLDVQGVREVCQNTIRHAMPQTVPGPGKPLTGLGSPPLQPGGRPLPQLVRRVVQVSNSGGLARAARLKQMP